VASFHTTSIILFSRLEIAATDVLNDSLLLSLLTLMLHNIVEIVYVDTVYSSAYTAVLTCAYIVLTLQCLHVLILCLQGIVL